MHVFRSYRLDLQDITTRDFNTLHAEYLPERIDQTVALRCSNEDDTRQQLEHVLLQENLLHQCTVLRSFCSYNVFSHEVIEIISLQLKHLPYLIRLDIIQCCILINPEHLLNFFSGI